MNSPRPPRGNLSAWRSGQRNPALVSRAGRRAIDVALELPSVRFATFRRVSDGIATLLCAPFALHGSTITDFAPRHSLVAALRDAGIKRLFVTDWRSASSDMRFFPSTIISPTQRIGGRDRRHGRSDRPLPGGLDGIGLCRALSAKIRKLALAGTPIDIAAGASRLSELARDTPLAIFRDLVELGGGRVLGQHALRFWEPHAPDAATVRNLLQASPTMSPEAFRRLRVPLPRLVCMDPGFTRQLLFAGGRAIVQGQSPRHRTLRGTWPDN